MSGPRPAKPNQTFGNPYDNYPNSMSVQPASQKPPSEKTSPQSSNESKPNNSSQPGRVRHDHVAHLFTACSAVGVLLVGVLHAVNLFQNLTKPGCVNGNGNVCVGSALYWSTSGYKSYSLINYPWFLGPFALEPNTFVDNWTPLAFGILACLQMFDQTRWKW